MDEKNLKRAATKEKNRLKKLLKDADVSQARQKTLEPVIENLSWMKAKLDDTREIIKSSHVVMPYDNGGGQKGIRANPAFKAYESLWKSYVTGMDRVLNALPKEEQDAVRKQDEAETPRNPLELVLYNKKKEA